MFGNKLNATIAKVTSFITELENGIAANEAQIEKGVVAVLAITEAETTKVAEVQAKAAAKRTLALEPTAELSRQNEVARKLLSKLA